MNPLAAHSLDAHSSLAAFGVRGVGALAGAQCGDDRCPLPLVTLTGVISLIPLAAEPYRNHGRARAKESRG
ncbi:hypothetical protein [Streptomyces sp. NPDC048636]|uniref:hypothetical protein n=1 Tax=Streptomyces sp. NPDC048636 TaxID=3155762 RepID=UPI003444FEB5